MRCLFVILFTAFAILASAQVEVGQLSASTQASIDGKFSKSDTSQLLAKRDTAKMLDRVRFTPAMYKQVIADSCYSTLVNYFSVSSGSIGSVTVAYGKTIDNTRVRVTPIFTTQIAAGLGDFVWYVHNITSSQCEISVHNNAASGLISIGFDVTICPNGF